MPRPKILIVEDEFLIRLTLAEALGDAGFATIEAATGQEALDLLAAHPDIALLLTDVHLPDGISGIDVARAARSRAPALAVIYTTGLTDSLADEGVLPQDVLVAKPYLPSAVCAAARRLTGM